MMGVKQPQYTPLSVAEIALSWFLADKGFLDDIALPRVRDFELSVRQYFHTKHPEVLASIDKNPVFTDEIAHQLKTIIETFKQQLNLGKNIHPSQKTSINHLS